MGKIAVDKLVEITDELMEQIVMTFYPQKSIWKEDKEGTLRVKKQYGEVRSKIFTILNNDLNGG